MHLDLMISQSKVGCTFCVVVDGQSILLKLKAGSILPADMDVTRVMWQLWVQRHIY